MASRNFKQKWTVLWADPEKGGAMVAYQQGLSRAGTATAKAARIRRMIEGVK